MDFWPNREVCCTAAVAADGDCSASNVGRMIIPRDDAIQYNSDLSRIEVLPGDTVHFGDDETSLGSLKIKETGLYIIVMATCDAKAERVRAMYLRKYHMPCAMCRVSFSLVSTTTTTAVPVSPLPLA